MATAYPQPGSEDREDLEAESGESVLTPEESVFESEESPAAYYTAQQLSRRPVVDISTGSRIGEVADLLVDPETLQVGALNVSSGGLFNRETRTIPASQVTVWGKDYVLVDPTRGSARESSEDLLNLNNQLRGRYIVSASGTRIGQVDDVEIDRNGHLHSYRLSQVFIEGPLKESRLIPASATQSLGKDVLIVDENKIR